jgi:CRP-like cAMP-binding protein
MAFQEFLRSVALFRGLDDDALAQLLMAGLVKRYPASAVILAEGAPVSQLHVIQQGQVRIGKRVPGTGEEALAILGPGAFFGEVEWIDGAPATAQAVAHTPCELLLLPFRELEALLAARPALAGGVLRAVAAALAGRLRDMNQRLATLLALSAEGG